MFTFRKLFFHGLVLLYFQLGTLKYSVTGVGTKPPKQQPPVIMKTETGVSLTTNIDFQNPANHPIRCDLSITSGIFYEALHVYVSKGKCDFHHRNQQSVPHTPG